MGVIQKNIMALKDLSIIVPLYNEEETIGFLYQAIIDVTEKLDMSYEIIFVDDGSSDKTFEKARSLAHGNSNLRVIKFRRNYGQTPAMAAGIDHARGKILITMDGDLQNDPADIPLFIEKMNQGYDIVVGWRHKRQDKVITRKIPSKIANRLIGKITGVPIRDNGCSLKAYRSSVIKNVPLYSEMHRFIPAMSSITGARIAEIKVRHHARKYGTSKYGLSRIYKVLLDLISIKFIISFSPRPSAGFGIMAILTAMIGFLVLITSISQSIFAATPLSLVVSIGVIMLLAVLSIFLLLMGILCELIFKTGQIRFDHLSSITAFKE